MEKAKIDSVRIGTEKNPIDFKLPYTIEVYTSNNETAILCQLIAFLMNKVRELEIRLAAVELLASTENKTYSFCGTGPCGKEEEEEAIKILKRIKEGEKND